MLGKSTSFEKAKDVMTTNGFNDAEQAADQVKSTLKTAQDTAMDYADKAVKVAKKNPMIFAAGAAGLGLLIGGLLARTRKH